MDKKNALEIKHLGIIKYLEININERIIFDRHIEI